MLSRELVAAQRRLLEYTDLISNLYTELETIRNIVCRHCKQRLSQTMLGQHPSLFTSQIPTVASAESHNLGSQPTVPVIPPHMEDRSPATSASLLFRDGHNCIPPQANLPNAQLASPCTASVTPSRPESPSTKSVKESAVLARSKMEEPRWSVTSNGQVEKVLDVTFLHAFKHTLPVNAVRFSADGNFLAAGCNLGRTHIYDVGIRSIRCALAEYSGYSYKEESPPRDMWCVCFSPDGRYLAVGSSFEMIYIWEISTKRVLAVFKGHSGAVRSLDLSPDGRLLVTGSFDGSVRIWRTRDGSWKPLPTRRSLFTSIRFSPDGRYVAASDFDGFMRIWNARSGQLVGKWSARAVSIRCVAFRPDGGELVSGGWSVRSWDVSSLKSSGLSAEKFVGKDGMLNKPLDFDGLSGEVHSLGISPDGKWLITGSSDNRVRIWDVHSGVQQCTLDGHVGVVSAVDFSPVGNYIATGSDQGFVTLWRYETM